MKVSGGVSGLPGTASFGFRTSVPGASATLRPVESVTVQATTESSVTFLPSTNSTRTVVTFAGPSVVPV